jgi:hypothetical protein
MTQRAPSDGEQEHGHGDVEGTQEVRRYGAQARREPAIHSEPHRRCDDHRERNEEQAEAIPAMDVVEIARSVAYASGRSPDRVGDPEP